MAEGNLIRLKINPLIIFGVILGITACSSVENDLSLDEVFIGIKESNLIDQYRYFSVQPVDRTYFFIHVECPEDTCSFRLVNFDYDNPESLRYSIYKTVNPSDMQMLHNWHNLLKSCIDLNIIAMIYKAHHNASVIYTSVKVNEPADSTSDRKEKKYVLVQFYSTPSSQKIEYFQDTYEGFHFIGESWGCYESEACWRFKRIDQHHSLFRLWGINK